MEYETVRYRDNTTIEVWMDPDDYETTTPPAAVDALIRMLLVHKNLLPLDDLPQGSVEDHYALYKQILGNLGRGEEEIDEKDELLSRIKFSPNRQYIMYCVDKVPSPWSTWIVLVGSNSPNKNPTTARDLERNDVAAVGQGRQRLRGELRYTRLRNRSPHNISHIILSYPCSYSR